VEKDQNMPEVILFDMNVPRECVEPNNNEWDYTNLAREMVFLLAFVEK
jgi:hypothetical protein